MAAGGETQGDLKAHEGTYTGFISLLKIGAAISAGLAAVVILLIAN